MTEMWIATPAFGGLAMTRERIPPLPSLGTLLYRETSYYFNQAVPLAKK
jgi:hypothetical protein